MERIVEFISGIQVMELAGDPRVLFAAAVLFVLSILFRWKGVLALLIGCGGTLAVIHYAGIDRGQTSLGGNMGIFVGGALVVCVVLIYFLFIKGD